MHVSSVTLAVRRLDGLGAGGSKSEGSQKASDEDGDDGGTHCDVRKAIVERQSQQREKLSELRGSQRT